MPDVKRISNKSYNIFHVEAIVDENTYFQKAWSYGIYGRPESLFVISTQDLNHSLLGSVLPRSSFYY